MIGIWNKDVKRQYTVHRTKFEEDMNSDQVSVIYDEQEVPSMIHCTQIEDNITYAPIGRIALYGDIHICNSRSTYLYIYRYIHIHEYIYCTHI